MKRKFRLAREVAIRRGLAFIYNSACIPENFYRYGSDYLCIFYCIYSTSRDPELRSIALALGRERARVWRRSFSKIPVRADADYLVDLVFGSEAADGLDVYDPPFKKEVGNRAGSYNNIGYAG